MKTLVIIPSRMSATRLPGKPLLKINGLSIISHVSKKAEEANIGDVIVATEDQEIIDDVRRNGFNAILTSNKHKTGTDRIHEALKKSSIEDVDFIMNIQGDEPAIDIQDIVNLNDKMLKNPSNIGTLAAKITDNKNLKNVDIVKVITENTLKENNFPRGLSFLRESKKMNNIYNHIGVYCYSRDSLEKFVQLSQSKNEIENRLEQLRALDNNMNINVSLAKSVSLGVDTMEDYLALKKIMEYKN
tara:strand:- start:588 stop:1319 length:732 start_codon:yes stop_codon:yes gene_type:complete